MAVEIPIQGEASVPLGFTDQSVSEQGRSLESLLSKLHDPTLSPEERDEVMNQIVGAIPRYTEAVHQEVRAEDPEAYDQTQANVAASMAEVRKRKELGDY